MMEIIAFYIWPAVAFATIAALGISTLRTSKSHTAARHSKERSAPAE